MNEEKKNKSKNELENEDMEKVGVDKKPLGLGLLICLLILIFLKISDPETIHILGIFGLFGIMISLFKIVTSHFSFEKQQKEDFIMFFAGLVFVVSDLIVRYL